MRHVICAVVISAAVLSWVDRSASAQDGECTAACPKCDHVCQLSKETVTDKKHCWIVECKPICIPRVTFPWEKCCEPKCAKLKYVNVLVKHEYECKRCAYKWTAVSPGCTCGAPAPPDSDPLNRIRVPRLTPLITVEPLRLR